MEYAELKGEIPLAQIIEALDDNGDGEADDDAWEDVLSGVEDRINDCFGGAVPERHVDATAYARKIFACEIIFRRRGFSGEKNPFAKQASGIETRLRNLSSGEESVQGDGGGEAITEPMKSLATGVMA